MEKLLDTITFKFSDPDISALLNTLSGVSENYPIYFNQSEDSFIKSPGLFKIPSFLIHHNLNDHVPSDDYISSLRSLVKNLVRVFPGLFVGTRYFFDPAEVLRPCFIQLFRIEESHYLYLLRLDLNIRISESRIIQQATNDSTAEFETDKLYFENMIIPVYKPDLSPAGGEIPINRLFKSTWLGESGTGYHINGQWMDRELTKFLSALYLPEGKKSYPYYPFKCDFNTVTLCPALISTEGRKNFIGYLHRSLPLIKQDIPRIEAGLKSTKFSRELPLFKELRKKIPDEWTKNWSSLKIKPYLNENEMREYSLEYTV